MPTSGTRRRFSSLRTRFALYLAASVTVVLVVGGGVLYAWLPAEELRSRLLVGLGAILVAEIFVLLLLGDRLLHGVVLDPLGEMVRDAERIAAGDHEHRIDRTGLAELDRVAGSMDRMAGRLLEDRRLLAENVASLRETNRALTEARDRLVRSEKLASVGRLAAGLGHEVGNPLHAILTYADVGRRRGVEEEWLEGITEEARRIDRIVSGLLDYARPKQGLRKPGSVNRVVRETVDLLETQGRLKDLVVGTELAPDLPEVEMNAVALQQVLINLVLNASDAVRTLPSRPEPRPDAAEAEIEIHTSLERYRGPKAPRHRPRRSDDPEEVDYTHLRRFHASPDARPPSRLERGDRVVVVRVLDRGPGLSPDERDRVFDPFYTTKEPGEGMGLGLAVSARLVAEMGGAVQADRREKGRGSVFTVALPVGVGGSGAAGSGGDDAPATDGSGEAGRHGTEKGGEMSGSRGEGTA